MPQVESLTVQILGDSSGLQQELNSVADLLDQLEQQLFAATDGAEEFGNALGGLSAAVEPLQALSQELLLINQQVQQISSQPVTLNVQPALDALTQLMQSVQGVAAQLAALSAASLPGPLAGFPGMPFGGQGGGPFMPRAYASGGIVTGPGGIDQVAARLTAGEFVLNQHAVATLGVNQLDRWNRGTDLRPVTMPNELTAVEPVRLPPVFATGETLPTEPQKREVAPLPAPIPDLSRPLSVVPVPAMAGPAQPAPARTSNSPIDPSPVLQTMNHFGGIEIHVQELADASTLMQDLRRQGIGARHRWG